MSMDIRLWRPGFQIWYESVHTRHTYVAWEEFPDKAMRISVFVKLCKHRVRACVHV